MNSVELLTRLRELNVKVWLEGDRLRYAAPAGRLTPELRAELTARRTELVAFLREADRATRAGPGPIVPVSRSLPLPLSFGQQRLWLLDQIVPDRGVYNLARAVRLHGALDVPALERSVAEIQRRHEILRTTFALRDGQPVQQVGEAVARLEHDDLSALDPAAQERRVFALASMSYQQPFDLAAGPLFRTRLLHLAAEEHVLLLATHHIAGDAVSDGILLGELALLYQVFVGGRPSPLPELPIQYADFAHWQRNWLKGDVLEQQLVYWKDALRGAPPVLELPTDRRRPPVRSFRGASLTFQIPKAVAEGMESLARREGATPFMVALAAFDILLHRYARQDDVVVGCPHSGRDRTELEGLIGFFVNSVILRLDLSGSPTVRELLGRTREAALAAFAHADVPVEHLVEALDVPRQPNANPLFQVAFGLQPPAKGVSPAFTGLGMVPVGFESNVAKFDMTWSLVQTGDGVFGVVEYNTDLFDAATIRRMTHTYGVLLGGMVEHPDTKIGALPLVTPEERDELQRRGADTRTEYPREATLPELFDAQARETPDAVAVVRGRERLSYRELHERSNRLAHYLRRQGVGPDVPVALCMERSIETVVGMLGVVKAGGAYVALDPEHPATRLAHLLEDTGSPIVLTQDRIRSRIPAFGGRVLSLDTGWAELAGESPDSPPLDITPEHLALVIYTSGSTGTPKGVCLEHRGVVRLVRNTNYWTIGPSDVMAQVSSTTFDAATQEVWGALLNGAALVVIPREVTLSPRDLAAALREHGVTALVLTTALFNQMARHAPDALQRLRYVIFAGETADPHSVRRVLQEGPPEHLIQGYGPAECTTLACWYEVREVPEDAVRIPIGWPGANTVVHLLDENLNPVPVGVPGELFLGGDGLARGYLNQPELTAEVFTTDARLGRLYRTGDLARYREDGALEFIGRRDQQVKLRGYRIEPGEVEAALCQHPAVHQAAVIIREDGPDDKRLVAYLVADEGLPTREVREFLRDRLPPFMVPSAFVRLAALPLNANGKVNRNELPIPDGEPVGQAASVAPRNDLEERIAGAWRSVLRVPQVGIDDNFFDVGGHSLLLIELQGALIRELGHDLPLVDLFTHPTIESLARKLEGKAQVSARADEARERMELRAAGAADDAIAIVAMGGRFPGAADVEAFWQNLREGRESIRFFTDEELRAVGVPDVLLQHPNYVKARGALDGVDLFDAAFFGYSAREADLTDPQQRIFLECAWEVMERGGYDPERYPGMVGVFAGCGRNTYAMGLHSHPAMAALGDMQAGIGSDRDFLPTRVSYKLNLRGPSINIQTACSTSLVAIHAACQSLRHRECDLALAGGVSIGVPTVGGYLYQEEGILSPDGHCRAFDAAARGTVSGSGASLVLLQRLSDAIRDGSIIHAVIRGSAINNDGSLKVGFTAPSVQGQAAVIALAQAASGVRPDSIGYIEAHGTGTPLGDPIEAEALTLAFGRESAPNRCAIGSVKSNVGHLDTAAGAASVIKAALCLEHAELVPSLHYERTNPAIDFSGTPFYVNTKARAWPTVAGSPRRAGVSSFGIGGTNAHAVLEQAPERLPSGASRPWQPLLLSARTPAALAAAASRLAAHLRSHPETALADVAYTLEVGRHEFAHRRAVLAADSAGAIEVLEGRTPARSWSATALPKHRGVVFMFPGQGAQYPGMGRELYEREPVFREVVDACAERTIASAGFDFREAMFPAHAGDAAVSRLRETLVAQLSLFAIELGLARLWMSWGVTPAACIGHSIGEYVAACLGEVLSLDDALKLVVLRGKLMHQAPHGAMLAVPLSEAQVSGRLGDGLWLSAINAPEACVVSGLPDRVREFAEQLQREGIAGHPLQTSGAFHSGLMAEVVTPLTEAATLVRHGTPRIPYLSNVTGTWADGDGAEPGYWGRHLREPVRFDHGLGALLEFGARVFLELGPGHVLSTLVRRRTADSAEAVVAIPTLRQAAEAASDTETTTRALARLWIAGTSPDWTAYRAGESRRRVSLPTYPFERERHWIDPIPPGVSAATVPAGKNPDPAGWFYVPGWKSVAPAAPATATSGATSDRWLVFADRDGLAESVAAKLEGLGREVVRVEQGGAFAALSPDRYRLDPNAAADYAALADALARSGRAPTHLLHAWSLGGQCPELASVMAGSVDLARGFYSVFHTLRAFAAGTRTEPIRVVVLSSQVHQVTGTDEVLPDKAAVLGLARVAPQERPNLDLSVLDLEWPVPQGPRREDLRDRLVDDLTGPAPGGDVAYRGTGRWIRSYEPVRPAPGTPARLREEGVYLITGGLGNVGMALAHYLGATVRARIVLVGRTALPDAASRDAWLASHDDADPVSARIRRLRSLEASGAEVLAVAADVADPARMREVLEEVEARFGAVHGVIHAAGTMSGGSFAPVESLTPADCAAQFGSKVAGAAVLADLLAGRSLDFCLLTSSLSTVLGGFDLGAYAAANAVLDALAEERSRRTGTPWISVNWDGWHFGPEPIDPAARGASRFALLPAEGMEAFARILSLHRVSRVVVSTGDLASRAFRPGSKTAAAAPDGEAIVPTHRRPDLPAAYVAPRDDVEAAIAAIWEELLGVAPIGMQDDYFELGGDSLIAVQLAFRMTGAFQLPITAQSLFEGPTIARLADTVRAARRKRIEDEMHLAQVLAMVQGLSEEEVKRFLAEGGSGAGGTEAAG